MTLSEVIDQMVDLANGLHEDVKQASNRVEHIRSTARANEAVSILHNLMLFQEAANQDTTDDSKKQTTDGE
jgi:hypothetical protein